LKKTLKKPRFIWNIAYLFLVYLCLGYTFFIGLKNVFRYNIFEREVSNLVIEYEKYVSENESLKTKIIEMEDDLYWEMQARKRLGYILKGEVVYKFVYKYLW
jgi:cell division protein FtsB